MSHYQKAMTRRSFLTRCLAALGLAPLLTMPKSVSALAPYKPELDSWHTGWKEIRQGVWVKTDYIPEWQTVMYTFTTSNPNKVPGFITGSESEPKPNTDTAWSLWSMQMVKVKPE